MNEYLDMIQCKSCKQIFTETGLHTPQLLSPCSHTLCLLCLNSLREVKNHPNCPTCTKPITSFQICEKTIKFLQLFKSLSSLNNNSSSNFLQQQPQQQQHQQQAPPPPSYNQCKIHIDQELFTFCTQCNVPICKQCLIQQHNGHILSDIDINQFSNSLNEFNTKFNDMDRSSNSISNAIAMIDNQMVKLNKNYDDQSESISNEFKQLIQLIQNREYDILKEIKDVKDVESFKLNQQSSKLKDLLKKMEQIKDFNNQLQASTKQNNNNQIFNQYKYLLIQNLNDTRNLIQSLQQPSNLVVEDHQINVHFKKDVWDSIKKVVTDFGHTTVVNNTVNLNPIKPEYVIHNDSNVQPNNNNNNNNIVVPTSGGRPVLVNGNYLNSIREVNIFGTGDNNTVYSWTGNQLKLESYSPEKLNTGIQSFASVNGPDGKNCLFSFGGSIEKRPTHMYNMNTDQWDVKESHIINRFHNPSAVAINTKEILIQNNEKNGTRSFYIYNLDTQTFTMNSNSHSPTRVGSFLCHNEQTNKIYIFGGDSVRELPFLVEEYDIENKNLKSIFELPKELNYKKIKGCISNGDNIYFITLSGFFRFNLKTRKLTPHPTTVKFEYIQFVPDDPTHIIAINHHNNRNDESLYIFDFNIRSFDEKLPESQLTIPIPDLNLTFDKFETSFIVLF
eukprot:gene5167-6432_t